jgi:hypothetical protein
MVFSFLYLALNFDPMSDDEVDDVVLAALRAMLDNGISELDAGLGQEMTPEELIPEVLAEVGLDDSCPVRSG